MKKKLVAAILCLVTLVGVLAGCNNSYVATDTSTRAMTVVVALVSDEKPSEDARLALRFAVGLDTATDDQRYAAGLTGNREFTSAVARDILRAAVGLPA